MTGLACDRCRAKKRRCVYLGGSKTCTICAKAGAPCITKFVRKQRAKPQQREQVKLLRERLEHIEDLLTVRKVIGDSTRGLSLQPTNEIENENQDSNIRTAASVLANESLSVLDEDLTTRSNVGSSGHMPTYDDLPSTLRIWELLQEYLSDFNEPCPLFSKEFVLSKYEHVYAKKRHFSTIDAVVLFVLTGIAHRLRAMSPLGAASDDESSQRFFDRAIIHLPELLMNDPTLTTTQCLVGLAVILHGTSNPEPASRLLVLALKMITDLIYTRRENITTQDENPQLERVYWIAMHMEMDLNIRRGRWFPIITPDIAITLPVPSATDSQGHIHVDNTLCPIFHHHARLAQIQARLIRAVFLFQTMVQDPSQILNAISLITSDMRKWREAEPVFMADPEQLSRTLHRSDLTHVAVLEAAYFNTSFVLRNFQDGTGPFTGSILTHLEQYERIRFRDHIKDARRLLRLLNYLPKGNYAYTWLIVEAVVSAIYVILNAVIQHLAPEIQNADLRLVTNMVAVMSSLVSADTQGELAMASEIISKLHEKAQTTRDREIVPRPPGNKLSVGAEARGSDEILRARFCDMFDGRGLAI